MRTAGTPNVVRISVKDRIIVCFAVCW
jgi:hypothetical protein